MALFLYSTHCSKSSANYPLLTGDLLKKLSQCPQPTHYKLTSARSSAYAIMCPGNTNPSFYGEQCHFSNCAQQLRVAVGQVASFFIHPRFIFASRLQPKIYNPKCLASKFTLLLHSQRRRFKSIILFRLSDNLGARQRNSQPAQSHHRTNK